MIDLTPLDVRKKRGDFRRILRGYDPGEVDGFLQAVEARMESLVMENLALTDRVQRLVSQLEALEGREKAVQEALVTAQKLREDVQDQSKREASSLREQAAREAEALRERVRRETESERGEAHREASILRDEAIREAASLRDHARRESELLRREVTAEIEARILEAEGLIKERQRAVEEIERSRRKFLKGLRNLLERELDAVEVEETRAPLEDTPLELHLKGWSRRSEGEGEGDRPAEPSVEESAADGAGSLETYERTIDLGESNGESLTDGASAEGWGAIPGDEPPRGEFGDIVPVGVFDPAPTAGASSGTDGGSKQGEDDPSEGVGSEPETDAEIVDAAFGSAVDQLLDPDTAEGRSEGPEPVWLSSLLELDVRAGGAEEVGELPGAESKASPLEEAGPEEGGDEPRID